jgi:glutathione S-transferase
MQNMKFYMTPGSCSTGIHIILEELEASFEVTIVNLPAGDHFKPEYVAINPKSTIPALIRPDGSVLTEAPAIAYWLGRQHPRAGLWPTGLTEETCALETMSYVVNTLHGQGFARIFVPQSFSRDTAGHDAVLTLGRNIINNGFAILNDRLSPDSYVAGEFSVADPILFYVLFWADRVNILLPPTLLAHYRRMLKRRAVQLVLREEGYNPALLGQLAAQEI